MGMTQLKGDCRSSRESHPRSETEGTEPGQPGHLQRWNGRLRAGEGQAAEACLSALIKSMRTWIVQLPELNLYSLRQDL